MRPEAAKAGEAKGTGTAREQLVLDFPHTPAQGEDDYLVVPANRLAFERVADWANWAEPLTLLTGPPKSGKSHLARIFADRSGAGFATPADIARRAAEGGTRPLVVEDVDRAGYDETALFHLLNRAMREHRPLLLTAREGIESWPYRTEDVRSRARRAVAFSVDAGGDIQLSQMLVKLFGDRQLVLDPRLIAYLVARMERSSEEAVALVDLMDRLALARGTAITRTIAAQALARRHAERGQGADQEGPERVRDERDD